MILDPISAPIQALGQRRFAFGARLFRERVEMIVDAVASGIQAILYPVSPSIEPVLDAFASMIETPVNTIAQPVEVTVCGKCRCHAADGQYCDTDDYTFLHFVVSP